MQKLQKIFVKLQAGKGDGLVPIEFTDFTPLGLMMVKALMAPQLLQVSSFSRGLQGEDYPGEKSGLIRPGSLFVKVNEKCLWGKSFLKAVTAIQAKLAGGRKSGMPAVITFAESPEDLMHEVEMLKCKATAAQVRHAFLNPEAAASEALTDKLCRSEEARKEAEVSALERTQALGLLEPRLQELEVAAEAFEDTSSRSTRSLAKSGGWRRRSWPPRRPRRS